MNQPLVSIIVPVYNVERYLGRCIESIRNQTYTQFECFLVNDGSTDASGGLCQAAACVDPRFIFIDKGNTGVSDSRNRAMDLARGKYLQFADGDDWLPPDATETFVRTAEATGCDLAVSHFIRVSGEASVRRGHIKTNGVMTRREYAEHMVKAPANYYYGVLWNKLYRRTLVEAYGLRCDAQTAWCEDFLFNLEYIAQTRLVATIAKPLYYYRKRQDSLVSTQATLRRTVATKKVTFAAYKDLYQSLDLYEAQKTRVYRYLISAATDGTVPWTGRAAPPFPPVTPPNQ